jgi:hypothetical protein
MFSTGVRRFRAAELHKTEKIEAYNQEATYKKEEASGNRNIQMTVVSLTKKI